MPIHGHTPKERKKIIKKRKATIKKNKGKK